MESVLGTGRGLTIIAALTNIDNLREPAVNTQTSVSAGRVLFFAAGIAILAWALALGAAGRAIRFSTLHAICRILNCEVAELLVVATG